MTEWLDSVPGPHPEKIVSFLYTDGAVSRISTFKCGVKIATETNDGGLKTLPTPMIFFEIDGSEFRMFASDARAIASRMLEFCEFTDREGQGKKDN